MQLSSFLNKGILRNDLKRFGWIGIVYFIGLFLFIPFRIIMLQYATSQSMPYIPNSYNYVNIFNPNHSPILFLLLLGLPVLTGTLLFRYLQTGEETTFCHALPVKRKVFYHTHMLAGFILLFIPLFLIFVIAWLLAGIYDLSFIDVSFLGKWLFLSLVLNLLIFAVCVLMGIITGMSFLQVLLTFVLLVLPSGLIGLLNHNLGYMLYGWPAEYYSHGLENYSLLLRLVSFYGSNIYEYVPKTPISIKIDYGTIKVCLFTIAVCYFLGLYLYNRRKLERAGEAITFDILREIFRYGVVFCFMLLGGSYLGESQDSRTWMYIGYFIASFLAYIGVEILLSKSLDIFKLKVWKGYAVYALVVIALLTIINNDMTGYARKMPVLDDVKYVYMEETFWSFHSNRQFEELLARGADIKELENQGLTRPVMTVFYDMRNIEKVIRLQEKIISEYRRGNRLPGRNFRPGYKQVCLIYGMKDGRLLCRQYNIEQKKYAQELKPIYESEEYKKIHFSIYRLPLDRVREMTVTAYDVNDKKAVIKDPALIAQAVEALKKDIGAMTYEEMFKPGRTSWGSVDFLIKSDNPGLASGYETDSVTWEKSFVYFDEWLKKVGKYEKVRVMPGEDVKSVLVKRIEDKETGKFIEKMEKQQGQSVEGFIKEGFKKIEDPQVIEYCLRNYVYIYAVQEEEDYLKGYAVVFVYKTREGETAGHVGIVNHLPEGI